MLFPWGEGWQNIISGRRSLSHGTYGRLISYGGLGDYNWAAYKIQRYKYGRRVGNVYHADVINDENDENLVKVLGLEQSFLSKVRFQIMQRAAKK